MIRLFIIRRTVLYQFQSYTVRTCCGSHIDVIAEITTPGVDPGLVAAPRSQMVELSLCGVRGQSLIYS